MKTSEKIIALQPKISDQYPARVYIGKEFTVMDLQEELIAIQKEVLTLEQNNAILALTSST